MDNYAGLMAGSIGYAAAPMIVNSIGGAATPAPIGAAISIGAVGMPLMAAGGLMNQISAMAPKQRRRRR